MNNIKRNSARFFAAAVALILLITIFPCAAFATEGAEGSNESKPMEEEVTTAAATTTERVNIPMSRLYVLGSNDKLYPASPNLSDSVDKYSFTIPNWMENASLYIHAAKGLTIKCSAFDFKEESGVYSAKITGLTKKSQSYEVNLTGSGSASRKLNITINRSDIPCRLDSVTLLKGDTAVNGTGSVKDGLSFTLDSGTTSGIKMRLVPRHEDKVYIYNMTGLPDGQQPTDANRTTLELDHLYKRYDYTLPLVEGTNRFRVEVTAASVTVTSDVTVVVGDPNANAPTTESTTTSTAIASATDAASTTSPLLTTAPTDSSSGSLGGVRMSPILWVLVGVIAAVVLGAIIFMIVNLASGKEDYDDYDNYDSYEPRRPQPRGRNLADYVDDYDDYDDYDSRSSRGGYNSRGGYSSCGGYSGGEEGYRINGSRGGYDDYDEPRPSRRMRSDYNDYDDYGY